MFSKGFSYRVMIVWEKGKNCYKSYLMAFDMASDLVASNILPTMGLYGLPGNWKQEGHDGPVSLHWLIHKIPSYKTLQYLGKWFKT